MASKLQKRERRGELRAQGLKQLEVWLPDDIVKHIDEMKTTIGADSRNEVLLRLIEGGMGKARLPASRSKLEARAQ
ncbi:hypothetical protein [Qipengyuania citrea]|uniref:hypothetical protein n=1 Tax=Qipengyuania citrea TaxID=225971 RepID=UPI003296E44B